MKKMIVPVMAYMGTRFRYGPETRTKINKRERVNKRTSVREFCLLIYSRSLSPPKCSHAHIRYSQILIQFVLSEIEILQERFGPLIQLDPRVRALGLSTIRNFSLTHIFYKIWPGAKITSGQQ